jgi:hypothetical protein
MTGEEVCVERNKKSFKGSFLTFQNKVFQKIILQYCNIAILRPWP